MSQTMSSSSMDSSIVPRIDVHSKLSDDVFHFTLSGVDVSISNALRRVLLSDIPIVVFRVSPNDINKCTIIANTCGLNNEIVKHRLSCIPIHIKDVHEFPLKNYMLEVNVQNNTDTTMYVTTKEFVVKDVVSGKALPEEKIREIFPPNELTGDFIDFVRLKAKASDDIPAKSIHLTCEFDIGTAKEDAAYNVVSTWSYGNTIDTVKQEEVLQQLKQKWKDDGKNESEIEFEVANWKLMDGKRIFIKDSFDYQLQTVGIHTNLELLALGCQVLMEQLDAIDSIIDKDELEIKNADSTIQNSFDIILNDIDYTLGNVYQYFMQEKYFKQKLLTYNAFKLLHPHDTYGVLRIAYRDPVELSTIKGHIKECTAYSMDVFKKMRKEFSRLLEK